MQRQIFSWFLVICLQILSLKAYSQIFIVGIMVNGKTLPYRTDEPIKLAALANDVIFTFSNRHRQSNSYEYKLEGFDHNWVKSSYPVARYTNLKGAEYELNVRVIVGNRIVDSVSIPVAIERELVEEWWFVPSVVMYILILLGSAMYFFILYNFRQKLKVQAIRNRIAADLHDEVGATLSSIALATNMIQRKLEGSQPEVQTLLSYLKADSEETINTISDTVWAINPNNDSIEKLFEKMRSLAYQVLTIQNISVQFTNEVAVDKSLKINMEQRRDLYLIFKEAINNIAKHSSATQVFIQITYSKKGLYWLIADNGVGFDLTQQTGGNGLKNFRIRAAESFIELEINSSPGKGTSLSMMVPEL